MADDSLTFSGRVRSVRFAINGIRTMLRTQHNAWIHAAATAAVAVTGVMLGLSASEGCWIVLAVMAVWTAEALNTLFHHRPAKRTTAPAKLEAAYHRADVAIQHLIDKVAA